MEVSRYDAALVSYQVHIFFIYTKLGWHFRPPMRRLISKDPLTSKGSLSPSSEICPPLPAMIPIASSVVSCNPGPKEDALHSYMADE